MTFSSFDDAQATVASVTLEFYALRGVVEEPISMADEIAKNHGFKDWDAFETEAARWGCIQWTHTEDLMAKRELH